MANEYLMNTEQNKFFKWRQIQVEFLWQLPEG